MPHELGHKKEKPPLELPAGLPTKVAGVGEGIIPTSITDPGATVATPQIPSKEAAAAAAPSEDRASLEDRGGADPRKESMSASTRDERKRIASEAALALADGQARGVTGVELQALQHEADRRKKWAEGFQLGPAFVAPQAGTVGGLLPGVVPGGDPAGLGAGLTNVADVFNQMKNPLFPLMPQGEIVVDPTLQLNAIVEWGLEKSANNPLATAAALSGLWGLGKLAVGTGLTGLAKAGVTFGPTKPEVFFSQGAGAAIVKSISGSAATSKLTASLMGISGFGVAATLYLVKDAGATYPFSAFQLNEAMQSIGIAKYQAIQAGRLDLLPALEALEEEVINPGAWESLLRKIPWANEQSTALRQFKTMTETAKIMTAIATDEGIAQANGETEDQKWARINQEQADQERASVDYFNAERIRTEREINAMDVESREDANKAFEESRARGREEDKKFAEFEAKLFKEGREDKEAADIRQGERIEESQLSARDRELQDRLADTAYFEEVYRRNREKKLQDRAEDTAFYDGLRKQKVDEDVQLLFDASDEGLKVEIEDFLAIAPQGTATKFVDGKRTTFVGGGPGSKKEKFQRELQKKSKSLRKKAGFNIFRLSSEQKAAARTKLIDQKKEIESAEKTAAEELKAFWDKYWELSKQFSKQNLPSGLNVKQVV